MAEIHRDLITAQPARGLGRGRLLPPSGSAACSPAVRQPHGCRSILRC